MKMQSIKMAMVKATGRGGLVLRKYSPEILVTVGVVGVIASTVMACRATLKAEEVLEDAKKKIDFINYAKETVNKEEYSEKDHQKDLVIVYARTGFEFAKLYGPAITLGVASIGCILGAHNIMQKRNVALIAAYKAVEKSFTDYRKNVVEEFGAQKDLDFKRGVSREVVTVTETDENGKKVKVKKDIETVNPKGISQYARFFDATCSEWSRNSEYNLTFLNCTQAYANDLLHSRGHVFLNEVYDMLGIPRTEAGAIVGWVKGFGDDFVDFGIYNADNTKNVDFVNGYESSILLDFNVAGIIYNLI